MFPRFLVVRFLVGVSSPNGSSQGGKRTIMKLKIRYENEFQTIELDAKATEEMRVTLSIEIDGAVTQDEKEQLIQEEGDKQFNRPEYNVYHRETRHIDPTPKKKRMDG